LYQLALNDAGALDYRYSAVHLAPLIEETIALHSPGFADVGLVLEINLTSTRTVRGDARRLAQLLDNLLANARRYTDAPGRVRVTLDDVGTQLRLSVEDTAPGVPQASLPLLFERLYRVERSRNRAAGGAGLGLAICRAIVEAHKGKIQASASPLGGLLILVSLPTYGEVRT
jgi:two-component system sensor histidine kinase BaeS